MHPDHLDIVLQGPKAVSDWVSKRLRNEDEEPFDLSEAQLEGCKLEGYYFRGVWLKQANLRSASLRDSSFDHLIIWDEDDHIPPDFANANMEGVCAQDSYFHHAKMLDANMKGINLAQAELSGVQMKNADLTGAHLFCTKIDRSDLRMVNFTNANFLETRFEKCDFRGSTFTGVTMRATVFVDCDLNEVDGLEQVQHKPPIYIDVATLMRLKLPLPEVFLKDGGMPDEIVKAFRKIHAAKGSHTVFVSYTHEDDEHRAWVDSLASILEMYGVRVILDQWELRPGDSLTRFMDQGISQATHAIFICTPTSVERADAESHWAGYEARQLKSLGVEGALTVIPVLRKGDGVPQYLRGILWVDLRDDKRLLKGIETILSGIRRMS